MIPHIEVLVYSFEPNGANFDSYVQLMKEYYVKHDKKLRKLNFESALHFMARIFKFKDQAWMSNLRKVGDYFTTLISNVIVKNEHALTAEVLEAALTSNDEFLMSIPNSKVAKETKVVKEVFWSEAIKLNNDNYNV